jgi:uncharacterized protein YjiS (DUF1127 family)
MVTIERSRLGTTSTGRRRAGHLRRLVAALTKPLDWLDSRLEKRRSRQLLMELSEYQLKDIGLSRCDAVNEGQRPFWR